MGKISRAREKELIEKYPDGETIGRAVIEHFLEERASILHGHSVKPTLSIEELELLRANINTDGNRTTYNQYVKLRRALVEVVNMLVLYEQSFNHGFYKTLYLLETASAGLGVLNFTEQTPENFSTACATYLRLLEENLENTWQNLIMPSLKSLYIYILVVETMGKVNGFDFSIIIPNIQEHEREFNFLENSMMDLHDLLIEYRGNARARGNKIKTSLKLVRLLEKLNQTSYEELEPSEETQKAIKTFIETTDDLDTDCIENLVRLP